MDRATDGAFGEHVASLSGVSGGSLGIAAWLAARETKRLSWKQRAELVTTFLSTDFLSPQLAGLFFLDAPRLVFGRLWPTVRRDDVFEAVLAARWAELEGGDLVLRPLAKLCLESFHRPPLVTFNATEALSGLMAPLTNLQVGLPAGDRQLLNALLRETNLKSATVLRMVVMSARFPFLSPAADIGVDIRRVVDVMRLGQPPLKEDLSLEGLPPFVRLGILVDGGYVDNSGLAHTRRLLGDFNRVRANLQRQTPRPPPPVVRILHFSNDPAGACWPAMGWDSAAPAALRDVVRATKFTPVCRGHAEELLATLDPRPLQWLTSPVETLLFVRRGHALREEQEVYLSVSRDNQAHDIERRDRERERFQTEEMALHALQVERARIAKESQALLSTQEERERNARERQELRDSIREQERIARDNLPRNSYFDYSVADALTDQLCLLRPSAEVDSCRGTRNARLRIPWHPGKNRYKALLDAKAVIDDRLRDELGPCSERFDQVLLPLGWALPRTDAVVLRCLSAKFVLPALTQ